MNDEKRGKFLCELRKRKKLTQQELGDLIHYTDKNISKWERGISFPNNPNILLNLAEIFDVSIEELMYGEFKTNQNEKEMSDIFVSKYKNNYNLYKKKIYIILILFLSFLVVSIISIYFIFIKNSIKVYTISLYSDNEVVREINSTLLITNKIHILNFSKINLKEEKNIENITLYYENNNKNKVILFKGENDNYYIEEKVGYEEYHLNEILDHSLYLELTYEDDERDLFLLKLQKKYSNNNIFPKTVSKSTDEQNIIKKDIDIKKLKDLGYEETQGMYIKKLNDKAICFIDLKSLNITIQISKEENIEKYFSNINSKDIIYEKISKGKKNTSKTIYVDGEKKCDTEICTTEEDYAKYINYLKKIIN